MRCVHTAHNLRMWLVLYSWQVYYTVERGIRTSGGTRHISSIPANGFTEIVWAMVGTIHNMTVNSIMQYQRGNMKQHHPPWTYKILWSDEGENDTIKKWQSHESYFQVNICNISESFSIKFSFSLILRTRSATSISKEMIYLVTTLGKIVCYSNAISRNCHSHNTSSSNTSPIRCSIVICRSSFVEDSLRWVNVAVLWISSDQ